MGKIATRFSIVQFGLTIFKATPNAEKPFEVHHRFVESTRSLRPPPPAILHPLNESRSPSSCFPHEVTHGTKCILDEECGFPYPKRLVTPCILPKNSNQIFTIFPWTTTLHIHNRCTIRESRTTSTCSRPNGVAPKISC